MYVLRSYSCLVFGRISLVRKTHGFLVYVRAYGARTLILAKCLLARQIVRENLRPRGRRKSMAIQTENFIMLPGRWRHIGRRAIAWSS